MGWLSRWRQKKEERRGVQPDVDPLALDAFRFDYHSHLVPGVDDGAPTLEASLEMIDALVSLGYEGAITTPHVYPDLYPNTPDTLAPAFRTLAEAVAERHPGFQLELGAEYLLDPSLLDLIREGNQLLAPGGRLLFEWSFHDAPDPGLLKEVIFESQMMGLQPVLAHIERYPYAHDRLQDFGDLADQGVWLQVNAASLVGAYGPEVQLAAETCIERGWVHVLGSDAHGMRHIDALAACRVRPAVHRLAKTAQNRFLM